MRRVTKLLFLCLLAAATFLLFLGGPDVVTSHEARVIQPARQMAADGWPWAAQPAEVAPVVLRSNAGTLRLAPDWLAPPIKVNPWIVPVLNGQVRLQKPPLPYWCSAILFRFFGFSETTARLTPALLGALATIILFDLSRRLFGSRVAWCTALAWVSTYAIPDMYRKTMADPYLAFFTLLCLWAWVRASESSNLLGAVGNGDAGMGGRGDATLATEPGRAAPSRPQVGAILPNQTGIETEERSDLRSDRVGTIRLSNSRTDQPSRPPVSASVRPPVSASPCPSVPASPCPSVPASPHPRVPPSPLPPIPASSPTLPLLLFYLSLALALLAKGPPALVTILFPLAAFHLCFRRPLPGGAIRHNIGIVLLLAIALPWPIYVWRNVPHALELWRYESVGELADNVENARPWWFYVPQLFFLSMPWTVLLIVGCVLPFKRNGAEAITNGAGPVHASQRWTSGSTVTGELRGGKFFPLVWWGSMILFFSFVGPKKNQYLLPAIPAQAMLIGMALAALLEWVHQTRFTGLAGAMVATQVGIGVVLAVVLGVLVGQKPAQRSVAIAVSAVGVAVCLAPLAMMFLRRPNAWVLTQAVSYVVLIVLLMRFYITPTEDARSPRPVVQVMQDLCRDPEYTILVPRLPEEASVYLPIEVRYGFGHKVLAIVDDTHGVRQRQASGRSPAIPEPTVEAFQGWTPDARVVAVKRVVVESVPLDYRWKLYELTVERKGYAIKSEIRMTKSEKINPRRARREHEEPRRELLV